MVFVEANQILSFKKNMQKSILFAKLNLTKSIWYFDKSAGFPKDIQNFTPNSDNINREQIKKQNPADVKNTKE